VELRRARFDGVARIDHHRQLLVIDRNEVRGVLGLADGFGNNHGDGFADEADAVVGNHRAEWLDQIFLAAAGQRRVLAGGVEAGGLDVGAGEHGEHALGLGGFADIDRGDLCVSMWRAHKNGEGLILKPRVIDEAPGAAHQRVVFEPHFALAMMGGCLAVHICSSQ
jgi:hypothetical protein